MPRVLKKTLQARARRLGVKGFSKMTYAQLEKAIATAKKKKPKRKTTAKKCTTRRKPMGARGSMRPPKRKQMQGEDSFDLYKFRTDLVQEIQENIEEGDYVFSDDLDIGISEIIDNAVTYNYQSALICIACNYYDWTQSEFGQINTMSEAAYAALNEYVYQDTDTYRELMQFFEDNA
jgi:anti-sigma28 factor (negative regulator of flagellin synthesis)